MDEMEVLVLGVAGEEECYNVSETASVRVLKAKIADRHGLRMDSFVLTLPYVGETAPLPSDVLLSETEAPLEAGVLTLQQCFSDRVHAQSLLHQRGILPGAYQDRLYDIACSAHEADDDVRLIELLLLAGADPNTTPTDSLLRSADDLALGPPLHAACRRQHSRVICALLDHNAEGDRTKKESPFALTCFYGKAEAAAELLRRGADPIEQVPNRPMPLSWASYSGCVETVRVVLEALKKVAEGGTGGTPETRLTALLQGSSDRTPIHHACSRGALDVVKLLHASGAELFPATPSPTPLTLAAKGEHYTTGQWVLDTGLASGQVTHADLVKEMVSSSEKGLVHAVFFYVVHAGVGASETTEHGQSALGQSTSKAVTNFLRDRMQAA